MSMTVRWMIPGGEGFIITLRAGGDFARNAIAVDGARRVFGKNEKSPKPLTYDLSLRTVQHPHS